MSRWSFSCQAQKPNSTGEVWEVGIAPHHTKFLIDKGDTKTLARLQLVKDVVEAPDMIIDGWSRPDKDDCFVYVGKPTKDYQSGQIELPAPPNMLFLVFVLPDGTIDHWNWRLASDDDPCFPQGFPTGDTT